MPLYLEVSAAGSFVTCASFVAFFHALLPGIRQLGWPYRVFAIASALTLAGQLWSIAAHYAESARLWAITLNIALVAALWLFLQIWRKGSAPAGTLLLSFMFPAILEVFRLGVTLGWWHFLPIEVIAGPWSLVMTTPLILMSVFQRSSELQKQAMQAEEKNAAKIEFLTKMSHELRTPLDIILGNTQLLARPSTPTLVTEGLDNIEQSGKHLLGMIDEILDHARGLAGQLKIHHGPVDWFEFLRTIKQGAAVLANKNGNTFALHVQGQPPQGLQFDELRVRQVLDNLLANAARHTQGGWLALDCTVHSQGVDRVQLTFTVSDSGEGIALADQERIFLPFERGSNQMRSGGKGVGMGLAISRQLAEAMGGHLQVSSTLGQGACFKFDLVASVFEPANDTIQTPSQAMPCTHYAGVVRTILVVDDEPANAALLSKLLVSTGFAVLTAACGQEAEQLFAAHPEIDLVITDQLMLNGDGWAVLQAVAQHRAGVPVVLVSAAPALKPAGVSGALQFAASFMRPVDHQALLRCVGELLGLAWIAAATLAVTVDLAPLPNMDEAALAALRELVNDGKISEIIAWADALRHQKPALEDFASQVSQAARLLDIVQLQGLAAADAGHTDSASTQAV
jgi:signal transduction histidine kinase/DNA-binding NarL/FixJ family response regulator